MTPHARWLVLRGAALLLTGVAASPAGADSWQAIEQVPGHARLTVQVSGAPRIYFRVSPTDPLLVPIEGPARLRVISRVEMPAGSDQVVRYTLLVGDGNRQLERESTESSSSPQVRHPDPARWLGKSRKVTVDVPGGVHRVTISVAGASALVRLQQSTPANGEQPTVSLTPVIATRSVLVSEGEKTITYYTSLVGSPVLFHVVGPTTLELLTRLDFDDTMRGTQAYRLSVTEKGRPLREVQFKTSKATTATYTNLKERVPSKFDRLQLAIGPGLHELAVNLISPARGAVEIHGRIPQPQTGNQE